MEYKRWILESSLLFLRLDVAYVKEKKIVIFDALAGPVKKMAILQHGPRHK